MTVLRPLGNAPWRLTVNGVDKSCHTRFDFRVTQGRQDSDSQPSAGSASFNLVDVEASSRVAVPGSPITLDVLVQATWVRVLTMTVSDVTRTFKPSSGLYDVAITAVGTKATLARRLVAGKPASAAYEMPQLDIDRMVQILQDAQVPVDASRDPRSQMWDDTNSTNWRQIATAPIMWVRDVPTTFRGDDLTGRFVDVEVDVVVDAAARICLWMYGVVAYYYEVPAAGVWRLSAVRELTAGAPPQIAIIIDGIPKGLRWDEEDPTTTWAAYGALSTWGQQKSAVTGRVSAARAWVNGWRPSDGILINPISRADGPYNALDTADATAKAGRGILWETPNGGLYYETLASRKFGPANTSTAAKAWSGEFSKQFSTQFRRTTRPDGTYATLEIEACLVLGATQWVSTVAGIINSVTINYGSATPDTPQPNVTTAAGGSIATYGKQELRITDLPIYDAASASNMGQELINQRAYPRQRLQGVTTLDTSQLPDLLVRDILTATPGSTVTIVGAAAGWLGGQRLEAWVDGVEIQGVGGRAAKFDLWLTPRLDIPISGVAAKQQTVASFAQTPLDVNILAGLKPLTAGIQQRRLVVESRTPPSDPNVLWLDLSVKPNVVKGWMTDTWRPIA